MQNAFEILVWCIILVSIHSSESVCTRLTRRKGEFAGADLKECSFFGRVHFLLKQPQPGRRRPSYTRSYSIKVHRDWTHIKVAA